MAPHRIPRVYELYFKTDLEIDRLATRLRELFNITDNNPTPYRKEQMRESVNWGGDYYVFEVVGLVLYPSNSGETKIPERKGWPFYLVITSNENDIDGPTLKILAEHLCRLTRKAGMETEVDSLSY